MEREASPDRTARAGRRGRLPVVATYITVAALALLTARYVRHAVLEPFVIPTGSMAPTLLPGDQVLVSKMAYDLVWLPWAPALAVPVGAPRRGDLAVFQPPGTDDTFFVKRVVGVPGDTLAMQARQLVRNGRPVQEPYLTSSQRSTPSTVPAMRWQTPFLVDGGTRRHVAPSRDTWGPIVIPTGHYFLLGDNRDDSFDSRYWGLLARDRIRGRAVARYWGTRAARGWRRVGPVEASPAP